MDGLLLLLHGRSDVSQSMNYKGGQGGSNRLKLKEVCGLGLPGEDWAGGEIGRLIPELTGARDSFLDLVVLSSTRQWGKRKWRGISIWG